jgi:hypothetical protein
LPVVPPQTAHPQFGERIRAITPSSSGEPT